MFSRLLPKKNEFFDIFDQHARTSQEGVVLLRELLCNVHDPSQRRLITRIEDFEHECDECVHRQVDLLHRSFITPFERDEIRALMTALDNVMDYAEAAAHRVDLYNITSLPDDMVALADVLILAHAEVVELVKLMRTINAQSPWEQHVKEINRLENEGDRYHRKGLASLFIPGTDALEVIKLKELFEMLEAAVDSCEDVADVAEGIIIEHIG